MRRIITKIVITSFLFQQIAWAPHLPWKHDFESSSVLPYHIDKDERTWVLLSKKTYKDKEYDQPAWGDFGGKVEEKDSGNPARAAARELEEESEKQIATTEAELLSGPFHQIDMKNSPFGEGIRRHTLFFKSMAEMFMPKVAEGIDSGPTSDGGREVSQYQWVLVSDLLQMSAPARFGQVLGLYTPDMLRVSDVTSTTKSEYFSVPFFVLLQQMSVKNILTKDLRNIARLGFGASAASHSTLLSVPRTFSQIVFTRGGFQDWRLVHFGSLSAVPELPAIPDDFDDLSVPEQLAVRVARSNAIKPVRELKQVLAFDSDAQDTDAEPVVQLRLLHAPKEYLPDMYPFAPKSPNVWQVGHSSAGSAGANAKKVDLLMKAYTELSACLDLIKASKTPALKRAATRMPSKKYRDAIIKQGRQDEPGILEPKSVGEITRYSDEMRVLKEAAAKRDFDLKVEPARLPCMTDAQLEHLGVPRGDLGDTAKVLAAYQAKVTSMRSFADVDTITNPHFVSAVKSVLAAERAHPELFTAYHGCAAEIHFLQTVYSVLGRILGFPIRTVNWRLFDRSFQRYGHVGLAFADTCQSTNQDNEYLNPFEILVAGNAALTGNPEHDGCRTLTYWKKSHSEVPLDLRHVLGDVFVGLGLDSDGALRSAHALYAEYEKLYYVDDPEPQPTTTPSTVSASAAVLTPVKRRIGVLRQILVAPEAVDESLALSGWFFNAPLSFADRTLPNGTVVSIYDGLETGPNAWMRELPDALRFMTHIRVGHSVAMEANIKKYHMAVPDGSRPFNLLDYEVRLLTAKSPAMVNTHYYPASAGDATREDKVAGATQSAVGESLRGTELPIRSFHAFNTKHQMLRLIIHNQLSITVAPAPVSLQQFKAAVAQGDLEAMDVYLSNPRRTKTFEEIDIVDGKPRAFTETDYMVMVAMRHHMAARTISSAIEKFKLLRETHPTNTPFALFGLLYSDGLNGLEQSGWDGSLAMPFRTAVYKEDPDIVAGVVPVAKKQSFKCQPLVFNVAALLQPQTTEQGYELLHRISASTDYTKLPAKFWQELVGGNHVGAFLVSGLMNEISMERWTAIAAGFASAGVDEATLYRDHHQALLELLHKKIIKVPDAPEHPISKRVSDKAAVHLLGGLVKANGRDAVLAVLKGFKYEFGVSLGVEKDAKKIQPLTPKDVYLLFKDVGLIDPTWQEFSGVLSMTGGREEEYLQDMLFVADDGYLSPWFLLQLPPAVLDKHLGHPVLDNALLEVSKCSDPIQDHKMFSAAEKKRLHQYLYTLAAKRGELANVKLHPADAGEWFAALPAEEQRAILRHTSFNLRQAEGLNFPVIYDSGVKLDDARRLLFPTNAKAVDLIFTDFGYTPPSQTTLEWLNRLLQPYAEEAFGEFLREPKKATIHAVAMFSAYNMQVPSNYSIEQLKEITSVLSSESVLVLSPAQIVAALKDGYRFYFQFSKDYQGSIRGLLQARLQAVQAEVKAGLEGDTVTKEALRTLQPDQSPHMPEPMKAFLGFLVA